MLREKAGLVMAGLEMPSLPPTTKTSRVHRPAALRSTVKAYLRPDPLKTWSWNIQTGLNPWFVSFLPWSLPSHTGQQPHLMKLASEPCGADGDTQPALLDIGKVQPEE